MFHEGNRDEIVEIGIYSFADITPDWKTGQAISVAKRYAEVLAAAKLADEAGLDVFGVGEHHRLDIAISSPATEIDCCASVRSYPRMIAV